MSNVANLRKPQQLQVDLACGERHRKQDGKIVLATAGPELLHERVLTHCACRPSRAALLSVDGGSLSYKGLVEQAQYVQGVLSSVGVWPNDIIASLLPDRPSTIPVMLGVSGICTYAPLSRNAPEFELDRSLQRLKPKAVFCVSSQAKFVEQSGFTPLIVKETGCGQLEIEGYDRNIALPMLQSPTDPGQIAFILQTSGTTGEARRVLMSHRMISHGAARFGEVYQFTPNDRSMVVTPLTHTLGLFTGVVAMLYAGASSVIAPEFDPSRFIGWWQSTEPTVFSAVSAIYQSIGDMVARTGVELHTPRIIRHAACPLSARARRQAEATFRRPMHLMYAMTEAIGMFGSPLNHATPPGSCGKVFCGEARVVDASGQPVPAGMKGEVQTRGPHLFSGYHDDEQATRDALKDGWLCSGDEGYFDADGNLFLSGRFKDVILRGGENVMPLEVDNVLAAHPSIKEALTFSVPCDRVGEEIAAAIVPQSGIVIDAAAIQDIQGFAASQLAEYKVPRHLVAVDSLPRNANGKPDRRACRELLNSRAAVQPSAPPPRRRAPKPATGQRSAAENRIRQIWSDLLGFEVASGDKFLDCGGTSLQALSMLAQVAIAFGLKHLSPALLWRAQSLSEFAAAVELEGSRHSGVFEIDASTQGRPLVWIGPDVAQHQFWDSIRGWRPIYGVTLPEDLWTGETPTIERAAAHCAHAIHQAFPQNGNDVRAQSITVAGWCAGGVVAFETARQLERLQPEAPPPAVFVIDGHDLLLHPEWGLLEHLSRFAGLAVFKLKQVGSMGLDRIAKAAARSAKATGSPSGTFSQELDVRRLIRCAYRSYRPQTPYRGALHHILATERPKGRFRHPQPVWGPYVGGTHDWLEVPGNHVSMFAPPHSHKLAAAMRVLDHQAASASGQSNAAHSESGVDPVVSVSARGVA